MAVTGLLLGQNPAEEGNLVRGPSGWMKIAVSLTTSTYVILPRYTDKNEFIADRNQPLLPTGSDHLNTLDNPRSKTLFQCFGEG